MGYKLTSLAHLPFDPTVEMYIFSLGSQQWAGGLGEAVRANFDNIARAIGGTAVIVAGLNDQFHSEVIEEYIDERDIATLLPALLISDAHPDQLTEKSLRVFVSLREVNERYGTVDDFLSDLAAFAQGESDQLLRKLESAPAITTVADSLVRVNIPVVPGIVAINLNAALSQLRDWWDRRRRLASRIPD
jgi:hypothetical protein